MSEEIKPEFDWSESQRFALNTEILAERLSHAKQDSKNAVDALEKDLMQLEASHSALKKVVEDGFARADQRLQWMIGVQGAILLALVGLVYQISQRGV